MLAQLFVPLVQVKLLPLPATSVAVPPSFRWVVLPALIAVPVMVVVPWQLPHTAAPALSLACFVWLFARCGPGPGLEWCGPPKLLGPGPATLSLPWQPLQPRVAP